MSKPQVTPGTAQALVEMRRARIALVIGSRTAFAPHGSARLRPDRIAYFCREAEDLYWNELAWEQITDEEVVAGGHLTELVFPGFLALIDALLLEAEPGASRTTPRAYPEAVEEILTFLGERSATLTAELEAGVDSKKVLWARAMTLHLIDLVLYRLYRLSPAERERVEALE